MSVVLLPLSKELPFLSLALPRLRAPRPRARLPRRSRRWFAGSWQHPRCRARPGKPPRCLRRARGSSAVVRGALPPAAAGSHRRACGHRAKAKGFQRRGGDGAGRKAAFLLCSASPSGPSPPRRRGQRGRGDAACPWSTAEASSVSSGRSTSLESFYSCVVDRFCLELSTSRPEVLLCYLGAAARLRRGSLAELGPAVLRRLSCCGTLGSPSSLPCRHPVPPQPCGPRGERGVELRARGLIECGIGLLFFRSTEIRVKKIQVSQCCCQQRLWFLLRNIR